MTDNLEWTRGTEWPFPHPIRFCAVHKREEMPQAGNVPKGCCPAGFFMREHEACMIVPAYIDLDTSWTEEHTHDR